MTALAAVGRVLILEDQADTRAWLQTVVCEAFGEVPTTALATLAEARAWLARQAVEVTPAIALIDLALPDGSGASLIREIAESGFAITPIVVSIYEDDGYLFDAIAAGAQGYLLKDERAETIVRRLREIQDGDLPLSPAIARRILEHFRVPAQTKPGASEDVALTSRERDVLALVARGLRIGDVAAELSLTRNTVAGYVKVIYSKLNISSRAEAALEARRRGLI